MERAQKQVDFCGDRQSSIELDIGNKSDAQKTNPLQANSITGQDQHNSLLAQKQKSKPQGDQSGDMLTPKKQTNARDCVVFSNGSVADTNCVQSLNHQNGISLEASVPESNQNNLLCGTKRLYN